MSRFLPQNDAIYGRRSGTAGIRAIATVCAITALVAFAIFVLVPAFAAQRGMTQELSNLRQLHMVMKQMALDSETTGGSISWTCNGGTPLTYAEWKRALTDGYLLPQDLEKLLTMPGPVKNAFTVFAVTESDPGNTVLFASKNWSGPRTGRVSNELYEGKGFVVFRKDGTRSFLTKEQATNTKLIGEGGQFGYLPLK